MDCMHTAAQEARERNDAGCFAIAAGDFNSTPSSPLYECAPFSRSRPPCLTRGV